MIINKNKLVAARENSLMNQFELSVASKVDLNFIRQLELNGGNVSKAIAEKLAIALSVRMEDITNSDNTKNLVPNECDAVEKSWECNFEPKAFIRVASRRSLDQTPIQRLIRIDQITSMSVDFKEPKIWIIYETGNNGMTSIVTECFKTFDERDIAWDYFMSQIAKTNNVIRSDANGCNNAV